MCTPGSSVWRSIRDRKLDGTTPAGPVGGRAERRSRSRLDGQDGAAAVEFAIVASLLFMLVFAIIDFGFGFHAWNNAVNAAREGARKAAVTPDVSQITQRVKDAATGLDQTKLAVAVTCAPAGTTAFTACGSWEDGDIVRVTVDYRYDMITPLPSFVGLGSSMNLHSVSEARYEG
jgi:Flp pilus assembly protein TadG